MFGGIVPKKMQAVMKQMGISQVEIPATRVVIETLDKNIVINNPSVMKVKMQGQESFQISGEIGEEISEDNFEEDIKTIVEKTGSTKDEAEAALKEANGDLTEAILKLS